MCLCRTAALFQFGATGGTPAMPGALYRQRQLVHRELDIDWQGVTSTILPRSVVGRRRPDEACRFAVQIDLLVQRGTLNSLVSCRSSSPHWSVVTCTIACSMGAVAACAAAKDRDL